MVRKSGGNQFSAKVDRSELAASYVFTYTIQPGDPESFRLVLTAHYNDGNVSNELSLQVDNRWGFFIRGVTRIARVTRSEEHTSELPSLMRISYAVFCLNKKNTNK